MRCRKSEEGQILEFLSICHSSATRAVILHKLSTLGILGQRFTPKAARFFISLTNTNKYSVIKTVMVMFWTCIEFFVDHVQIYVQYGDIQIQSLATIRYIRSRYTHILFVKIYLFKFACCLCHYRMLAIVLGCVVLKAQC